MVDKLDTRRRRSRPQRVGALRRPQPPITREIVAKTTPHERPLTKTARRVTKKLGSRRQQPRLRQKRKPHRPLSAPPVRQRRTVKLKLV